jgi:hypothetical protein
MNPSGNQRGRRGSRPIRIVAGQALAMLSIGVIVAACGTAASPSPSSALASVSSSGSPGASASAPTSSASSDASTGGANCASAGLHVTGGPWGGAAGSRGADVVVENMGSADCVLPVSPAVTVNDPSGAVLVRSGPAPASGGPTIRPTGTVTFSLLLGNWCDRTVTLPVHLELDLSSGSVKIANLTAATFDELPPCNGPGQPPTLSATDWTAR